MPEQRGNHQTGRHMAPDSPARPRRPPRSCGLEAPDADEATARKVALEDKNVLSHTEGKEEVKFIYVPGRIVNIVVK